MRKKQTILVYLLILGMPLLLEAQQAYKITGRVIDDQTQEPVPFTNVYLQGTSVGTTTDQEGYYTIETSTKADSVICSAVGYSKIKKDLSGAPQQVVNFRLGRSDVNLDEVVVQPGKDFAYILHDSIVAHKDQNNAKEKLANYQYEVYNKIEIDIDNVERLRNRKITKPFQFVFDNIDSTSEEKPFLPVYITETISNYYYRQNPEGEREKIIASRLSGNKNESIAQFLGNMYQDINVYNNWINMLGKGFASPVASFGPNYYKYKVIDSAFIDKKWCRQIRFVPKRKSAYAFQGDMWITDSTYAIKKISMQVAGDVNVNFVESVDIFQSYRQVKGKTWFIEKDKLIMDFVNNENVAGLMGRKTTTYRDIGINDTAIGKHFQENRDVQTSEDMFKKDEDFWQERRHEKLSDNERAIYGMVDSLQNLPVFQTYLEVIKTVFGGWQEWGPLDFGPYFTLYSFNEVEGHRFRVGMRTNENFSKRIQFGGYGAYGLRDNAFKYGGNLIYLIQKRPRMSISLDYKNDVDVSSDNRQEFGQDNLLAGFYRRPIPQKLIHVHQGKAFFSKEWDIGYSNKVGVFHRRLDPYFNFNYRTTDNSNNGDGIINDVITTEAIVKLRFAHQEKFVSGTFDRLSLGSDYPIAQLQYTYGVPGVLESQFNYHKLILNVTDDLDVNPIGSFSYNFSAGKVFGTLPYLLLEVHKGNETYFYNPYSFNMMNQFEFASDQYLKLFVSHHFEGFFFNKIPWVQKLNLRTVVTGKAVWGGMSEENRYRNKNPGNDEPPFTVPSDRPYMEVGVGIENILRFFRVDAIWRLNYLDKSMVSHFGIRGTAQLKF